jgi:cyclophilin family peptidyl-prolyl cis-trans isomerase
LIQGGGYTHGMVPKKTHPPIENEAYHGISNSRYTVALARDADPNSGTSQFFVNLADNRPLDFESPIPGGWRYTVFGRVIEGTEVIDVMALIPVLTGGDFMGDMPSTEILLEKARVLAPDGK